MSGNEVEMAIDKARRSARTSAAKPLTGIREVARLAGVSVGTVSNVLNRPEKVSEETLRRVEQVIERLDFVPNRGAADLRTGRSRMIGLVVPDITNPFFAEVARGAVDAASQQGYVVVLCNSDQDIGKQDGYLDVLEEQRVAGVLINPIGKIPSRLGRLRDRGSGVVLVDRTAKVSEYSSVAVDDVRGGQVAVEHLLASGARTVAMVNGPATLRQCADRRRGARKALDKAGRAADDLVEVSMETMSIHAGVAAAERLLALDIRPDAVFCANDLMAIGVTRRLTEAGLNVPDDVAVAGYDDVELAAEAPIPLTSIGQPKYELGQVAAELLLKEIAGGPDARHERIVFQPHLTERQSTAGTGPIRQAG
ncbi:MAG TPA: LacI family DNA-binding transcriptional regulator [Jiangellaceae bacterium]